MTCLKPPGEFMAEVITSALQQPECSQTGLEGRLCRLSELSTRKVGQIVPCEGMLTSIPHWREKLLN